MSLFKKNNQLVELLNKLNKIENKMDILDNKFESLTFMDGCCDCRKRETKIYNDLQEYLDDKLLHIKNALLDSINVNFTKDDNDSDSSSDVLEGLENLELKLKKTVEDIYSKHRNELLETLQKCCEIHENKNKTDLVNLFHNLNTNLVNVLNQLNNDIKTTLNEKDLSLRTDLQQFLISLQKDINSGVVSQTDNYVNHLNNINDKLTDNIKELESYCKVINDNVNSFYYENELIKQQLFITEELRNYENEIDILRNLAHDAKKSVDNILDNFEFVEDN